MEHYDILIIGGGAAGIAAAKAAEGAKLLLAERKSSLGGVLLQCAHRGFGRNMTGAEYARELLSDFPGSVSVALDTTVLSVSESRTALLSGRSFGRREISFSRLILATGCREIPIGALPIAGTRPKGVYTAGQMQELMNLQGFTPEGPAVILGSGDLGLVMAKQLLDAGLDVSLVELKNCCGGMARNRQALENSSVKYYFGRTVTRLHGAERLEGCTLSDGSFLPCRLLLTATGLRPERELVRGLESCTWLQLCGNCSSVHPMVESVVIEGKNAGLTARNSIKG